MVELFECGEQVARAAGEAIELPDQYAVDFTVPGDRRQGVELGPTFPAARHGDIAVVPDDIEAGARDIAAQTVILQVIQLVGDFRAYSQPTSI